MEKWKEVWNRRKVEEADIITLQKLIYLDGFDSPAGKINVNDWNNYIEFIRTKAGIKNNDTIFEVGCGSGAFIFNFYLEGNIVAGIDYSDVLIAQAIQVMPDMNFLVCYAHELETNQKFDYVISNSVFFYFNDLDYSQVVLDKMIEKSKKAVLVLDVPDLEKKADSEKLRKNILVDNDYLTKYQGLKHLYYNKKWFHKIAIKKGLDIEIFDQNINKYLYNRFRFNCILKKKFITN